MASDSAQMPINQISWTEIPCTDTTRVQKFYGDVFGWTCKPMTAPTSECTDKKDGDMEIILFSLGTMHGCFVKVKEENLLSPALHPDNPGRTCMAVRVTIDVKSIDEKLKEIKKAGGKLYKEKAEIPNNMGHIAYFTDSEGNVMGLWSML